MGKAWARGGGSAVLGFGQAGGVRAGRWGTRVVWGGAACGGARARGGGGEALGDTWLSGGEAAWGGYALRTVTIGAERRGGGVGAYGGGRWLFMCIGRTGVAPGGSSGMGLAVVPERGVSQRGVAERRSGGRV